MASSIFTLDWVKGAGERALKSGVQGGISGLGLSVFLGEAGATKLPSLVDIPWASGLSGFVLLALLSIATSVLQPDFTAGAPKEPPTTADSAPVAPADEDEDEVDESLADEPAEELPLGEEPVEEGPSEAGLATGVQPGHAADEEVPQ